MERTERLESELGVSRTTAEMLAEYWERMLIYNAHTNLTAITQEDEVFEKHFRDSATGDEFVPQKGKIADIGSGGGFPAMVLAILQPEREITMIEATGKKAKFLQETAHALGLKRITVVNERIETYAKVRGRGQFDCVTARALASLNTLMEYAAPLLKKDGKLVAYKGKNAQSEIEEAKNAAKILGMTAEERYEYFAGGERTIISYRKTGITPETYPRPYKKMKERPL